MSLSTDFQFSQATLQDYKTCPQRFKLRYLDRLRWPAIESEPVHEAEKLAKLGTDFHHLVRQHLDFQQLPLENIDIETTLHTMLEPNKAEQSNEIEPSHEMKLLQSWWESYLQYRPLVLSTAQLYSEITFSAPLRGHRLIARFDVLAIQPNGKFVIIDWKTSQKKPKRSRLANRIQTHVYPYVLAQSGTAFNHGQPINPTDIRLIYWYPSAPTEPEIFDYNVALMRRDEETLSRLIEQIKEATTQEMFPLVESEQPCQYCVYRSLCNRGAKAGPLIDLEADIDDLLDVTTLDWEQVAEIQF